MKRFFLFFFLTGILMTGAAQTPNTRVDKVAFFNDTSVIQATLLVNMSRVFSHSKHGTAFPGRFITTLGDGRKIDDSIQLEIRGHFRQGYCAVPPLKLRFNYKDSAALFSLKSLKLVSECKLSDENEQNLIKEFLIYKMYNVMTDLSFRVRLLRITFQDSAGKRKPIIEHAFVIEDVADLARRNGFMVWKRGKLNTEMTNRDQMTMVALFEFFVGNTDWAVSVSHNTRLIVPVKDSLSRPYVVPYDFDYSGLVNTYYAIPDTKLEIESVTERLYRGFPRTMPELQSALDSFRMKKKQLYAIINDCPQLTRRSKEYMIDYLDGFYASIKEESWVQRLFIENARKQ